MQPVARVGDMCQFPNCQIKPNAKWPIKTGSDKFTEEGKPVARVTDIIDNQYNPMISTGSATFSESGQALAVIGDKCTCPVCGIGYVVEGAPKFSET